MIPFDITGKQPFMKMEIIETLRGVIDPELQINIIDMGLVYSVDVNEEERKIEIEMTLSSPNCPMGASIAGAVENSMEYHFHTYNTVVNLVWEPVWSYERISEEGKRLLGI